ncbi:aminoglycoside phosphotransferase family protein [Xylanimonas sp. McL0601]|uniref:aminoglycoside phosphotransferase family protein n=1 Tax=Xylanimonas sp. McL0601 TaxID=3414739 RepID=UPI003CFB6356
MDHDPLAVPERLHAWHREYWGEAAQAWVDAAPGVVARLLDAWALELDGPTTHGAVGWIVPVRRSDGGAAVLKVQPVDDETVGEPVALRTWDGDGAVRLLAHDEASGAMLLERLDAARSLEALPVPDALDVIGGLLGRLHRHAAPAGVPLRSLAAIGARVLDAAPRAAAPDAGWRAVLDGCAGALAGVLPEPGHRFLHWDLHYTNVLAPLAGTPAAERGDWLAIDPKPLVGDPCYELLAAVHNRWEEAVATGDPERELLRRFDQLTEVASLDRDRAAAWTLGRCLTELLWVLEGHEAWFVEPDLAVARALLARRG